MKSLDEQYIKHLVCPQNIIADIRAIGEFKGKEELYTKQAPDVLEKLLENALIESSESSNRIEGITAPHSRVKLIVKEQSSPKNRPEQEIAGYKDVLNLIHQSHKEIPVSENVILQFHSMLYRYTTVRSGSWKTQNNAIIERLPDGTKKLRFKPVSAFKTPQYMSNLISIYNEYQAEHIIDNLILIPLFVFDFLCIHPFLDGNGRIGRLLTLLLLYQAGYKVGKYISLERIIEESKESYYDTLKHSSNNWHEGKHTILPWLNYFHGMLIAAYKEFEQRVGTYKGKGSKTSQIKSTINRFIKPFSITEIEKACPHISRDMIRAVLRELRNKGIIKSTSKGRGALWVLKVNK